MCKERVFFLCLDYYCTFKNNLIQVKPLKLAENFKALAKILFKCLDLYRHIDFPYILLLSYAYMIVILKTLIFTEYVDIFNLGFKESTYSSHSYFTSLYSNWLT